MLETLPPHKSRRAGRLKSAIMVKRKRIKVAHGSDTLEVNVSTYQGANIIALELMRGLPGDGRGPGVLVPVRQHVDDALEVSRVAARDSRD